MSNAKSVLGFDDNITSRRQDIAPTQYAIGKLRAARTPKDRSGAVINNLNCILYPDLYVMTLNANTVNISDSDGNVLKSGTLYLYHIVVDPDESISGGHVVTSASVQMNVRQIAYYHNGTTEKVLTRVGTPLASYSGSSVDLLSQVQLGQASLVFVRELGMWVKRQTTIELAVNWTPWKEFGGGGSSAPIYTFLDTVTNGVSLEENGLEIKAVGHKATANQYGVVKVTSLIAANPYSAIVPSVSAVYNALMAISQRVDPLINSISAVSFYATQAINSANTASELIQNHLDNHPSTPNASYTLVNGVATTQVAGSVKTAPYLSYVTNATEAKYSVPTMNAVCAVSQNLTASVDSVSAIISDHIANHPAGGTDYAGITPIHIYESEISIDSATTEQVGVVLTTNTITEMQTPYDYIVPTAAAVWRALKDIGGGSSIMPAFGKNRGVSTYAHDGSIIITGVPAQDASEYGVVKVYNALPTADVPSQDAYAIVPGINLLRVVSGNLSSYVDSVSQTLSYHIANHPTGGANYNGVTPIHVYEDNILIDSATTEQVGVVQTTNIIGEMQTPYDHIVPTAAAVWQALKNIGGGSSVMPDLHELYEVSAGLSRYIDQTSSGVSSCADDIASVSRTLSYHITNHPTGGTNYNGVTPIHVYENNIYIDSATTTTFGTVKIAATVTECPYAFVVPSVQMLYEVSSGLNQYIDQTSSGVSNYVDAVSTVLAAHVTNAAIHGGGGGTYSGVAPVSVNDDSISVDKATTDQSGIVRLTRTVASNYYDYYVPTATAVWQAIQNAGGGSIVGSASIDAPSYSVPSEWSWSVPSNADVVYTGYSGSSGGWLLISIVCATNMQGCIGIAINGNYIPLFGGSGCANTKVLPIPSGATFTIYNGAGGGATVLACGYNGVSVTRAD